MPAEATVLEPGCGIGNFFAHAPTGMRFIGVELDRLSGRIARVLHPGGRLVCLGIHPCFVGHHVDSPTKSDSRLGIVPGYRHGDWVQSSEQFGPGIRSRVGARHVPLADYLMGFMRAPLQLERPQPHELQRPVGVAEERLRVLRLERSCKDV